LAKQMQRNTSTSTSQKLVTASNAIRNSNDVFPGSRISVDQYQSAFPGRLPDTAGRERFSSKFNGGTILLIMEVDMLTCSIKSLSILVKQSWQSEI